VDQSQAEFLIEIEQLVEQIFIDLDELRQNRANARVRRQLIDQIFRRVHSVKGSAASSGLDSVSQIAHRFENLLDAVRSGRTLLDVDVLDTCENAAGALNESLTLAASGIEEPSRTALFDQLQRAAESGTGKPGEAGDYADEILKNIPFDIWQTLSESEKHSLITVVEERNPLYLVLARFEIASFDAEFFRLKDKLAECGEVISTSPAVDDKHPDKINFRLLYASAIGRKELEPRLLEFSDVTFTEVAAAPERDGSEEMSPSRATTSLAALSNSVRVDLDNLDHVLSSTHELFLLTLNALNLARTQAQSQPGREDLEHVEEQIRTSFKGIEADLINLRMVSLGPTLQRAVRAGRVAAQAAGKEVDFEILGAELRVDKLLADAIADPLMHLVRNAVDHGIEHTEARARAGKERRGRIRIETVSEDSQTRVRVTDDGNGIDPILVSAAAKTLGIIDPDSPPDFERSMRLIFRPGFTTLATMSGVSGRGVGLDIVETAVEQVGGDLRVSSALGRGTTFEVGLPVTFGLLAATVFVCGATRYCIPASQSVAVEAVNETATSAKEGRQMKLGTDSLPLVSLRELLGQPGDNGSREERHVIVLQFPNEQTASRRSGVTRRVGLLVDAVEGNEELLIRGLGRYAGRWYGVAGATELRDGSVALVLDLPRLLASL
jgi:two-component system chemotaxis sensor kinase CheA